ncbi:MAG TPA: hypothetical protein VGO58_13205 [Chitinophagaceae bacterium]|jgi:hypothetical protein|nr:hypothetical protein [Chitinophagaceae bacterium]
MKQIMGLVCIASFAIGFNARNIPDSGIHGSIDPIDGGSKVWAINGTDSFSTIPVSGKFSVSVKPGNWSLLVEAIAPYKNTVMNGILVLDNQSTDAGVIKMNR